VRHPVSPRLTVCTIVRKAGCDRSITFYAGMTEMGRVRL